jgi:hypothetical protein
MNRINLIDTKQYMIYQNTITEFDFRQYLFARQCKLLFALNRPAVVAERAVSLVWSLWKWSQICLTLPDGIHQ